MNVSPLFSGASLRFSVDGDGVSVDPATGIVSVATEALLAGVAVRVIAANSGGEAEIGFTLRVTPAAAADIAPAALTLPSLSGAGLVGEPLAVDPGVWAGAPAPDLALQWLRDGAEVEGATAAGFTPGAAEDGALVSCRVTATNAAGAATAETPGLRVVRVAPAATGAIGDVVLALGAGPLAVPAAPAFAGEALVFAASGAGASADPATGVVTVPAGALVAGEAVTVTATNSGGAAELRFAVTVLAAPAAAGAPEAVVLVQGAEAAAVETAGFFTGSDLVFALVSAPEGVAIDPETGVARIPTADLVDGEVTVSASNAVGAAELRFAVAVRAAEPALEPPVALGAPLPVVLVQGTGAATVSAQAFFAGEALAYVLEAGPAGATINPGSGLVTIPTAEALEAEVAVRAENAAGAARVAFTVTVRGPQALQFDAAAKLADLVFVQRAVAPSWTFDAAGHGVLVPGKPSDITLGDWQGVSGDGRYRALVRITHSGVTSAYNRSRPFGINGRISRDADGNWRGVRIELDRRVSGATSFEIREYQARGEESTLIATAAAPWDYGAWLWVEAEFEGQEARARLYPEAAQAPDWQARVTLGLPAAPGFFGPMGATLAGSIFPIIHIRRLEYLPLASAAAPAAPEEGDWSLEQITVLK